MCVAMTNFVPNADLSNRSGDMVDARLFRVVQRPDIHCLHPTLPANFSSLCLTLPGILAVKVGLRKFGRKMRPKKTKSENFKRPLKS